MYIFFLLKNCQDQTKSKKSLFYFIFVSFLFWNPRITQLAYRYVVCSAPDQSKYNLEYLCMYVCSNIMHRFFGRDVVLYKGKVTPVCFCFCFCCFLPSLYPHSFSFFFISRRAVLLHLSFYETEE